MQKRDSLISAVVLALVMIGLPFISKSQESDLKPVTEKYAITNATIVQAPGKIIKRGTIVIEDGIIKSVGSSVMIPQDAWVIDADSMFVYAGFISGMSNHAIEKPKEQDRRDDRKLTGTPTNERAGITPEMTAAGMVSTSEKSISDFRKLGFTAAQTAPHNGMLPGQSAVILLGGDKAEDMIVKSPSSMSAQLSGASGVYPNTVIGVMAKYRDLYRKADQARAYELKYGSSPNGMERPTTDPTLQAFYPVVTKDMSVAFKAEGVKDIMRVLSLQKDLGFKLMLTEVKQGWDAIPTIKAAGAPVFLSLDMPEWKEDEKKEGEKDEEKEMTEAEIEQAALTARQNEIIKKYYTQAAAFQKSGIPFGFSTMEVKSKDFKSNLLRLIENGLTSDQALAALTTTPASLLGLSSTMGSVEAGKLANLIVTDTAYFTKDANVRHVFVEGTKYDFEVKKKKKKKSNGESVDAAGVWNYTTETPQGDGSGVITIKGTPGDYSGTISVSFNDSTNELKNIEMDGNNMTFSFSLNMGEEVTVDISMTIDGDTFEGTLSVASFGSFPMEGSRDPK